MNWSYQLCGHVWHTVCVNSEQKSASWSHCKCFCDVSLAGKKNRALVSFIYQKYRVASWTCLVNISRGSMGTLLNSSRWVPRGATDVDEGACEEFPLTFRSSLKHE